jgi:hypothetical protein
MGVPRHCCQLCPVERAHVHSRQRRRQRRVERAQRFRGGLRLARPELGPTRSAAATSAGAAASAATTHSSPGTRAGTVRDTAAAAARGSASAADSGAGAPSDATAQSAFVTRAVESLPPSARMLSGASCLPSKCKTAALVLAPRQQDANKHVAAARGPRPPRAPRTRAAPVQRRPRRAPQAPQMQAAARQHCRRRYLLEAAPPRNAPRTRARRRRGGAALPRTSRARRRWGARRRAASARLHQAVHHHAKVDVRLERPCQHREERGHAQLCAARRARGEAVEHARRGRKACVILRVVCGRALERGGHVDIPSRLGRASEEFGSALSTDATPGAAKATTSACSCARRRPHLANLAEPADAAPAQPGPLRRVTVAHVDSAQRFSCSTGSPRARARAARASRGCRARARTLRPVASRVSRLRRMPARSCSRSSRQTICGVGGTSRRF